MKLSFKTILFLLPLLFAQVACGDINSKLLNAAETGDSARVEQLLKQGADVNEKKEDGTTALIRAVRKGHIEIVKTLIDAGADVNVKYEHGGTALMDAAAWGHTEIAEILRQAGAKE